MPFTPPMPSLPFFPFSSDGRGVLPHALVLGLSFLFLAGCGSEALPEGTAGDPAGGSADGAQAGEPAAGAFDPGATPVRIAATMSLTGALSTQGVPASRGYSLCVDHLNAEGGILGRPVELRLEDDASSGAEAATRYAGFVEDPAVDLLLGPYGSTLTAAVAPVTERAGRVHLSPLAATSSLWEQGYRYLFMVLPPAEEFLSGVVEVAREDGLARLAILHEEALFPAAAAAGAEVRARARGLDVVLRRSYATGEAAFAPLVAEMVEAGVQAVAMAASDLDGFIHFTRALREAEAAFASAGADFPIRLLGTSGAVAEFVAALGPASEGVYGLSAWEPSLPNPGNAAFVAAFVEAFDTAPSFHAAGAYGTCRLLAEGVELAGTLGQESLREALLALETTTVFGPYRVDDRGFQVANGGVLIQWQDGEKRVVWPPELATHPRR